MKELTILISPSGGGLDPTSSTPTSNGPPQTSTLNANGACSHGTHQTIANKDVILNRLALYWPIATPRAQPEATDYNSYLPLFP